MERKLFSKVGIIVSEWFYSERIYSGKYVDETIKKIATTVYCVNNIGTIHSCFNVFYRLTVPLL